LTHNPIVVLAVSGTGLHLTTNELLRMLTQLTGKHITIPPLASFEYQIAATKEIQKGNIEIGLLRRWLV